jgi:hypothetical protein
MKNYRSVVFVSVSLLLIWVLFVVLKFYGGYAYDLYKSPWAYSLKKNSNTVLVGSWKGEFTDPNGIKKQLYIRIDEPISYWERWDEAIIYKKRRRSSSNNAGRFFDGSATVKSKLGLEEYTVSGHVNEDDYHQFNLHFSPVDEKKRVLPNFTLFDSTPNLWQGNDMNATLKFAYHKADGSSFWDSSNPKYSAKIACKLGR